MSTPTPTPLLASMHAPGERPSLAVVHGRGARLTLEDGRETIDAGSLSSCLLGHCHPELVQAVQAAAETVYAGDSVQLATREQAARDLLELAFAGEDWADQVVFTVSSSEAADLGLLLAQLLTGREPLVARESGYHGGVGLAREVSLHRLWGATLASPDGGVHERPPLVETRVLPVPAAAAARPSRDTTVAPPACARPRRARRRRRGDPGLQPGRRRAVAGLPGGAGRRRGGRRRALHRRRDGDRARADGPLVRLPARRRPARPGHDGQGHHGRRGTGRRADPLAPGGRRDRRSALDDVEHLPRPPAGRRRDLGHAAGGRARRPGGARGPPGRDAGSFAAGAARAPPVGAQRLRRGPDVVRAAQRAGRRARRGRLGRRRHRDVAGQHGQRRDPRARCRHPRVQRRDALAGAAAGHRRAGRWSWPWRRWTRRSAWPTRRSRSGAGARGGAS